MVKYKSKSRFRKETNENLHFNIFSRIEYKTAAVLIFFAFGFVLSAVSAQGTLLKAKQDSLYTFWQDKTQPDSLRLKAYYDYIRKGFLFSNPDTAFLMAEDLIKFGADHHYPKAEAVGYYLKGASMWLRDNYSQALEYFSRNLNISESIGDKKDMTTALGNIGLIYSEQGDYAKALEYYQRSLKIAEEMEYGQYIATSYLNIADVYHDQGDYVKALEYSTRCLKKMEEIGDKDGMAKSLNNIGNIYIDQGDQVKALDYYTRSLKIKEDMGNEPGMAASLNNIGNIYLGLEDHAKALEYEERSLEIYKKLGDKNGMSSSLFYIGNVYGDQNDLAKALEYCKQSLTIREEIGNKQGMVISLNNLGVFYFKQKDFVKAQEFCHKGYDMALAMGALPEQKVGCSCLYDVYKALGNSTKALYFYEKMSVLKDSLFNEENTKKLTRLEMQYDFDMKEAATQAEQEKKDAVAAKEMQRQKLVRNGFMSGFAVVFLFAGIFFIQRNRIGKEKKRSEELLLNILPEETAKELKEKGRSDAQLIDQASVLFTDFKGFTAISDQLSPKELVQDLHSCFSAFDHICEKYGIEKIKTVGDAYMAAGGLPRPTEDSVKNTVLAALDMQAFVSKRKTEMDIAGRPAFEMRVGIHTGPVVAGIVGVKKFQYDIWSDTVNTANRMEANGEVGKVNISQTTYELLKEATTPLGTLQFNFEMRGRIEAKGKGEMEMYFVEINE